MKAKTLGSAAAALALACVVFAADERQSQRSNPHGISAPFLTNGPTYGPTSLTLLALTPWDFQPISSEVTYQYQSGGGGSPFGIYRTNASGNVWFEAPVHLPSGALVTQGEVTFCDTGALDFFSWLASSDKITGVVTYYDLVFSSGTPGCSSQVVALSSPVTIDNNANSYTVEVNLGGTATPGDSTILLGPVRLSYMLQVSPAPGVATFTDVPISDFAFQFIEAFNAAGITVGCNLVPPQFCPDNNVTRREMAVFFAKALGLHFPN